MSKLLEMPPALKVELAKRYNLLGHINFLQFDRNFDWLQVFLKSVKKTEFALKDRIIVEHQDTDIYIEHCSVGINLRNFFYVARQCDIPNFVFLFYTNHYGIQREFDLLCNHLDYPQVIETFVSTRHTTDHYEPIDHNINDITHRALCMMNTPRSHRFALYNRLRKFPDNELAMAIRAPR